MTILLKEMPLGRSHSNSLLCDDDIYDSDSDWKSDFEEEFEEDCGNITKAIRWSPAHLDNDILFLILEYLHPVSRKIFSAVCKNWQEAKFTFDEVSGESLDGFVDWLVKLTSSTSINPTTNPISVITRKVAKRFALNALPYGWLCGDVSVSRSVERSRFGHDTRDSTPYFATRRCRKVSAIHVTHWPVRNPRYTSRIDPDAQEKTIMFDTQLVVIGTTCGSIEVWRSLPKQRAGQNSLSVERKHDLLAVLNPAVRNTDKDFSHMVTGISNIYNLILTVGSDGLLRVYRLVLKDNGADANGADANGADATLTPQNHPDTTNVCPDNTNACRYVLFEEIQIIVSGMGITGLGILSPEPSTLLVRDCTIDPSTLLAVGSDDGYVRFVEFRVRKSMGEMEQQLEENQTEASERLSLYDVDCRPYYANPGPQETTFQARQEAVLHLDVMLRLIGGVMSRDPVGNIQNGSIHGGSLMEIPAIEKKISIQGAPGVTLPPPHIPIVENPFEDPPMNIVDNTPPRGVSALVWYPVIGNGNPSSSDPILTAGSWTTVSLLIWSSYDKKIYVGGVLSKKSGESKTDTGESKTVLARMRNLLNGNQQNHVEAAPNDCSQYCQLSVDLTSKTSNPIGSAVCTVITVCMKRSSIFCGFSNGTLVEIDVKSIQRKIEEAARRKKSSASGSDKMISLASLPHRLYKGHNASIESLVLISRDTVFVSCSADSSVRLWNVNGDSLEKVWSATSASSEMISRKTSVFASKLINCLNADGIPILALATGNSYNKQSHKGLHEESLFVLPAGNTRLDSWNPPYQIFQPVWTKLLDRVNEATRLGKFPPEFSPNYYYKSEETGLVPPPSAKSSKALFQKQALRLDIPRNSRTSIRSGASSMLRSTNKNTTPVGTRRRGNFDQQTVTMIQSVGGCATKRKASICDFC